MVKNSYKWGSKSRYVHLDMYSSPPPVNKTAILWNSCPKHEMHYQYMLRKPANNYHIVNTNTVQVNSGEQDWNGYSFTHEAGWCRHAKGRMDCSTLLHCQALHFGAHFFRGKKWSATRWVKTLNPIRPHKQVHLNHHLTINKMSSLHTMTY